jgi:hypothetical protein
MHNCPQEPESDEDTYEILLWRNPNIVAPPNERSIFGTNIKVVEHSTAPLSPSPDGTPSASEPTQFCTGDISSEISSMLATATDVNGDTIIERRRLQVWVAYVEVVPVHNYINARRELFVWEKDAQGIIPLNDDDSISSR